MEMKRICLALFATLSLVLPAFAQTRHAVVNVSACFLRSAPDYESSLESQCLMGTVVEVTDSDRYWRKVNAPDYKACWTNDLALAYLDGRELEEYVSSPKMICVADYAHLYASPAKDAARVCDFVMGDIVRDGGECRENRVKVLLPDGRAVWAQSSDIESFDSWAASRDAAEESVVSLAKSFLGTPYMWGGNTVKGFDCSGFVKLVYMMNGVVLPRNAREQVRCGEPVPYDFSRMRPGDLLFFGRLAPDGAPASVTHVAMYVGGGQIIHSSQVVRINSLRKGSPDFYERTPIAVRRILLWKDGGKGVAKASVAPWFLFPSRQAE